ncbi:MAG: HNH endonuclease [Proteobacteria bacterium]|nr:HNH endonuclease [Pseudomonadota bacterium]
MSKKTKCNSGAGEEGTYHELDERNYKLEYANYQGKPEQIARRSSRNKARRIMTGKGLCKMGDGNDVDHKDRNPLNNDIKNLRVQKKEKNRSFCRKVENGKPLEDGTSRTAKYHKKMTPGQGGEKKKMKFKELRNKINEWSTGHSEFEITGSDTDIMYIENEETRVRLNAFIKAVAYHPTLNVYETLAKVRVKLNGAGLDFEPPKSGDVQEVMQFPLSLFGGRTGMGDDGQPINDDGLNNRTGRRWVLNITTEETSDGYVINPSIEEVPLVEESWLPEGTESYLDEGKDEERELELFVANDAQIYRSRLQPIYKNLITKIAQGKYDEKLAIKAFMYAVEDAAKKYTKDFGTPGDNIFDKKTKLAVAATLASEFKDEADDGNYDDLLPKKYRS